MASFVQSTKEFLIKCELGGGPPFPSKYRRKYRVFPKGPSKEEDIGVGYMLFDPHGNEVTGRRFWNGIDLHTNTLSDDQVLDLFEDVFLSKDNGIFNSTMSRISTELNLNQNQYDALTSWIWAYGPYETAKGKRSATGALFDKLRQYKGNFLVGYNDIQQTWTKYCTTGGKPAPSLYSRRIKEFNLFFSNVTPDTGIAAPTGDVGNSNNSTRDTTEDETLEAANQASLEEVFSSIEANQTNLELDNIFKSWGSRNSLLEESDWIGLKQFLIYLCSTYYPQNLVPFAELIPVYSLNRPQNSNPFLDNEYKKDGRVEFIQSTNKFWGFNDEETNSLIEDTKDAIQNDYFKSSTGLDYERYNRTVDKLDNLLSTGGADLLSIDPFYEVSNSLNEPNEVGKTIIDQRGYGYKLFSSITLNPGITEGATSKAGGVGFTSIQIESGSAVQNQMSLITIKMLDIQANKFIDINSPWSFLLNGPSRQGGDFYFRYGWQVRVPKASVGPGDTFKNSEDLNAEKFWNHEGWKLFDKQTKMYILETASLCDNIITLTQSNDPESFKTPGYLLKQESGAFKIQLDRKIDPFKYLALTLINPEVSVNPEDGSMTATLYFRTQAAVANCQSILSGASNMYSLFSTTNAKTGNTTLLDLITAFIKDNKEYINTLGSKKVNSQAVVEPLNVRDWIQVIGGSTTNSRVDIDPSVIPIKLSQDLLGELNRCYLSKQTTVLLLEWLNKVLDDNNCKILTIGDQDVAGNSITGALVIAYEGDLPQNQNANSIDSFESLTISGAKRLQLQDDVFSFKFRGSLVENLSIERIEGTTEATNEARQSLANEINNTNADNNTFMGKNDNTVNQQFNSQQQQQIVFRDDRTISLSDKKRNLAIIFNSTLKATIKAIAHPWIKIGRNIYIKGTGFYDGKYIVTKVTHNWDLDNKFLSTIECMRVTDRNEYRNKQLNKTKLTNQALNNPSIQKAESIPYKTTVPYAKDPYISNTIKVGLPNPVIQIITPPEQIVNNPVIQIDQNAALGQKISIVAINESRNQKDLNLQKWKNFTLAPDTITNYDASYISLTLFKATYELKEALPIKKTYDLENLLEQFKSQGRFSDFITSNYIPKKGDIVFWANHAGVISKVISKKAASSSIYKLDRLTTIELVDNKLDQVNRNADPLDYFTNNGVRLLGFGVI